MYQYNELDCFMQGFALPMTIIIYVRIITKCGAPDGPTYMSHMVSQIQGEAH